MLVANDILQSIEEVLSTKEGQEQYALFFKKDLCEYAETLGVEESTPSSNILVRASSIGETCLRKIQLSSYPEGYNETLKIHIPKKKVHNGRMFRLLQRGHLEECRFSTLLRMIGLEIYTLYEGKQFKFSAFDGKFKGHMDGIGVHNDKRFLLEFKTSSQKYFNPLVKYGVYAEKYMHYSQMQTYMKAGGLDYALYLCVCKDTDELYCEIIPYNLAHAEYAFSKAEFIIDAEEIVERHKDWKCNYCDFKGVCDDFT